MSALAPNHYRLTRPDGLGFFRRRSAAQFAIGCAGLGLLLLALVVRAAGPLGRGGLAVGGLIDLALGVGRTPAGEDLLDLVGPFLRFESRRATGRHRYAALLVPSGAPPAPPLFSGISLLDLERRSRQGPRPPVGLVVDRADGSLSAVLRVHGGGFLLADHHEQDASLGAFGAALAGLGREDSAIVRCTWSQFVAPASVEAHLDYLDQLARDDADEQLRASYLELVHSAGANSVTSEVLVTLSAAIGRVRPRAGVDRLAATVEHLADEVAIFAGELAGAGLRVTGPLPAASIGRALRERCDPSAWRQLARRERSLADVLGLVTPENAFPLLVEERRRELLADGTHHRLLRVAEWPRTPVAADWLAGFLCEREVTRSFTVSFAPQSRQVARRQALSVATRVGASIEEREQHGRRVGAEERRAQLAVEALDEELESGAAMELVVGLVDVAAPDADSLEGACERTLQSAADVGIELRPVTMRQGEAFVCALPLGRGVGGRAR